MAEAIQFPSEAGPYIDDLVRALHENMLTFCRLRATEVVKGGSLGQGTAVSGNFDLDLVVYSQDIQPSDMLDGRSLQRHLENLHCLLSERFGARYKKPRMTEHALRFTFGGIEVDLLPSPYWSTPADYHSFLQGLSNAKRRMFSCSAAKWQKKFFAEEPEEVKEYIRRAKAWRNSKWPAKCDGEGRPKSFLIGLLVAEAYRRSRTGIAQSVTDIVKNYVRGHSSLHIHWTDAGALYSSNYKEMFPSQPYIIDPANPFNNVYISGIAKYEANSPEGTYEPGDGNWTVFVRYIDTLNLSRPNGI